MYNTHPTILDQNSNFYNESAKLACIFNDISVKQESILIQSVSEQVIWVREIASEETQWVFGRLIITPMPISYEKSGAQFSIFISCASAYSMIRFKIEYVPSSEPDELNTLIITWRAAYPLPGKHKGHMEGVLEKFVKALIELLKAIAKAILELMNMFIDWIWKAIKGMVNCVLQPIKDTIKGFVRGISNAFGDSTIYLGSSNSKSKGGTSGDSQRMTSGIQKAWDGLQVIIILLTTIFVILEAIEVITYPFTSIGAVSVSSIVSFCKPILLGIVAGAILTGTFVIIEDAQDGKESESSEVDELFPAAYGTLGVTTAMLGFVLAKVKGTFDLAAPAYACALAITGLILSLFGAKAESREDLLILDIFGICLEIGGLILAVKSGFWGTGRLVPKIENLVTIACCIGTFASVYSHIKTGKY